MNDMQADKSRILKDIADKGIGIAEGIFSKSQCEHYIEQLEEILVSRQNSNIFCGNDKYQVIYNYFQNRPDLFGLLYQDYTDSIMRALIDDDYVLISPSARNRQLRPHMAADVATSGVGWHFDTRTIGNSGKALQPTPIYFCVIALEDFSFDNGATFYIPGSHLWYRRPDDRNAELDASVMEAKAGSAIFFDSAIWHKVGEPGERSRWSVFNMFGPWFMKPYFRFYEMFSDKETATFDPQIRQLLHLDAIPPKDHTEGTITLRRVRERVTT